MTGIRLERTPSGATLTIENPQRGNALTPAMMQDMASQIGALAEEVQGSSFGALVITGSGERAFCAGYDLGALARETRERPDEVIPELIALLDVLHRFPATTIAAVNGHAIGGGALLASLCDLRYARVGVRFRIPTTRIGILYPMVGMRRLVALLGLGRTAELLLLAEDLDAERARAWGLFQEVLPDRAALLLRVEHRATELAERAPLAIRGALAVLRSLSAADGEADRLHAQWLARCVNSADLSEGLAAVRAGRAPDFAGR